MSASRFECPRCQTVFVKDIGGDAAFVECPSCGALALPAGNATEGDLSRALSGPQAAPPQPMASTEGDQAPTPNDPSAPAPGLFAGLLDDVTAQAPADLPLSALTPLPPPPASLTTSASSGGGSGGSSGGASASVSGSARAPELDFDFGGLELDLPPAPTTNPGMRSLRSSELSSPFSAAPPPSSPSVHALTPSAMAALAGDAEAGPTSPGAAPWSNNTLSEEAFGDLEKAFDEMALRPQPAAGSPRGSLSVDEERFLRGDDGDNSGARARPPPLRADKSERTGRPEAPPSLPPKRAAPAKAARRSTHFQLSDEAKRLAFLPLVNENSGSVSRQRSSVTSSVAVPRVDRVDRGDRVARERVAPTTSGGAERSGGEDTDLVREKQKGRDRKPVPSAFQGLSIMRAMAIVIVCGILGGVGGAFTAPPPKTASTPRARAELRFADGNRFYDAQRFDDALGAFRGAISIDPTFALAHRAKGAALAKLNRHDEAATAYEEYLKLEPTAVDVTDVKAALLRREGKSSP